ncbi:MAG: YcaO-like family protein [Sulfitobacter pontiacus]|uniref:YcaO-like family protein n=1 Tax=Sulfitobacter pontiacus TaxID=60137 RepID=UPI0032997BC1
MSGRGAGQLASWLNGPTKKISLQSARVAPIDETERKALKSAKNIPMTRLANLGLLDKSRPCVFGAVTPLARDLTTHLGKGLTPAAARVSAMMEAIERASAEAPNVPSRTASYSTLKSDGVPVLDPKDFALPPQSKYDPDRAIKWTSGVRLPSGEHCWIATDLIAAPPSDDVIFQPDTNGLASGNTLAEAILHGLCELVERDALGRFVFARLYGDAGEEPLIGQINPATVPPEAQTIMERIETAGHSVKLFDHSDIGLPVVSAYLTDPAYPGPEGPRTFTFFGFGCATSAKTALLRALTEAEQSRVSVLQGARDSFNSIPGSAEPTTQRHVDFDTLPDGPSHDDLLDDMDHVLSVLRHAGFHDVYACDLTHPKFDIPVVRVLVPGLSVFLVDRSRVSWRDLACLV